MSLLARFVVALNSSFIILFLIHPAESCGLHLIKAGTVIYFWWSYSQPDFYPTPILFSTTPSSIPTPWSVVADSGWCELFVVSVKAYNCIRITLHMQYSRPTEKKSHSSDFIITISIKKTSRETYIHWLSRTIAVLLREYRRANYHMGSIIIVAVILFSSRKGSTKSQIFATTFSGCVRNAFPLNGMCHSNKLPPFKGE